MAIVGGGGKTSLMVSLAWELTRKGRRVVTATTTKVWHREALDAPLLVLKDTELDWRGQLREGIEKKGFVFLGKRLLPSGKIEGIDPALADSLYGDPGIDHLILEADGAAGRPLKAPAEHEPVVPASVTVVVALMGLEAIGKNLNEAVVFRPDRFERVTGLEPGGLLAPDILVKVFQRPDGLFRGTPAGAGRLVFLNKSDLLSDDREAKELARLLLEGPHTSVDRVVIGSIKKGYYSTFIAKP
jgi:probable selenium-dependent hydroxylase accessory protein YqeC